MAQGLVINKSLGRRHSCWFLICFLFCSLYLEIVKWQWEHNKLLLIWCIPKWKGGFRLCRHGVISGEMWVYCSEILFGCLEVGVTRSLWRTTAIRSWILTFSEQHLPHLLFWIREWREEWKDSSHVDHDHNGTFGNVNKGVFLCVFFFFFWRHGNVNSSVSQVDCNEMWYTYPKL